MAFVGSGVQLRITEDVSKAHNYSIRIVCCSFIREKLGFSEAERNTRKFNFSLKWDTLNNFVCNYRTVLLSTQLPKVYI